MATIFDLFEVTSISENTTYSEVNGNLLGVVDNVSSTALDDGEFDEGDSIFIGGVPYTIDEIEEPQSSGRFTLGDGTDVAFDPQSESNLDVVFLTVSNGGDVRYFIIPSDRFGDMNVASITTGNINPAAGSDAALVSTTNNNTTVVCFVSGSLIATPDGEVPVEDLREGDLVLTKDNGAQRLRKRLVHSLDFQSEPDRLRPVVFEKNALGSGRPRERLCVSPNHRMLMTDDAGQSILVPAKALTGRKGVRIMHGQRFVTYYHLVFSRHEIVYSNGVPTESFYPGHMAMQAIPEQGRLEVRDIFGLDADAYPGGDDDFENFAAPVLRVQDAKRRAVDLSVGPSQHL